MTIPADVLKTATDLMLHTKGGYFDLRDAIACAIMEAKAEEREQCALIAETCPDEPFAKHGQWHGTLRKSIASAIRNEGEQG